MRDHPGSTDVLTDYYGVAIQRYSFDAFGVQRNADAWVAHGMDFLSRPPGIVALSPLTGAKTFRGFTGHEMVDEVGLVHMNGRSYDPHLGRFLQADPLIQAPSNSQSLNRYSYVFNNPLSYTDPSGFSAWGKYRNTVVAVILAVLSWWCNGCAAAPYLAAISMLRTFYVANKAGSLDGAVKGAFVNWAIGFVIQYFYGFNPNQNIVTATVVGGTASRLTGGSFSNGAQSSAFSWALNWSVGKVMTGLGVKQWEAKSGGTEVTGATDEGANIFEREPDRVARPQLNYDRPFFSYDDAVEALEADMLNALNAGNPDWEYGGVTARVDLPHEIEIGPGEYLSATQSVWYNSNIVTSRLESAIGWSQSALNKIHNETSGVVALHHYHPLHAGVMPKAFSDHDINTFRAHRSRYGVGYRALYLHDKYGTRAFNDTTNYRGIACKTGIRGCL